jgi:ubiquinone biosynthesis protein
MLWIMMGPPTAVLAKTPTVTELLAGWQLVVSLVGALVIAAIAGRLLGVRRSWGTAIAAGLVGWVSGAVLAVVLARSHEGGEAGFTRNLWLFATFFTMSATVWIEMLAKPGALARAQGSLVSIPRPIRSLRHRSRRVSRYVQVTRIAAKHGFGHSLGANDGEDEDGANGVRGHAPIAMRLRGALEECGGVFVKLGQVLSTRSDLLPPAIVDELSKLQDRVSLADPGEVMALLERELRAPVVTVFAAFDASPVAAASIGQTYRATLHSGEAVIVKVQRPGIAATIERDLDVLHQLAATLEARAPWAARYRVAELAQEFADRLREELDFRVEARNATDIAAITEGDPSVHIPRVHPEMTTARVLVMEWLDGVSVRESGQLDARWRRAGAARRGRARWSRRCPAAAP